MEDPYQGREQTQAKHFILKGYLQALSFKILAAWDELIYIDGFSGPWQSKTEDFSDTSFKIAIEALRDAQKHFRERGYSKTIRCFLVEKNQEAYRKLEAAVSDYNDPVEKFHVKTYQGKFEDAVPKIMDFVGTSFTLTFLDPTGWTGYPYEKIQPLLAHKPGEVLINFMYDFINRAGGMRVPETEQSLDPILGGPGWFDRLNPALSRGEAMEELFRSELTKIGEFEYVVSACIKKAAAERTHFFMAYGTRKDDGLVAFREVEWQALRKYEPLRVVAKLNRHEERTGIQDLFKDEDLPEDRTIEQEVQSEKWIVQEEIPNFLKANGGQLSFRIVRNEMLQRFRLRHTDLRTICASLGKEGIIEETWKLGNSRQQKPDVNDIIKLVKM